MHDLNPLFIPEPIKIHDRLRNSMNFQTRDHRAPADKFANILKGDKSHQIKAVFVTHDETATGVRSDIAAVRHAMKGSQYPALLLVDCVNSLSSNSNS